MDAAIDDLRRLGATVVNPVEILHAEDIVSQGNNTWGRWLYENGDALDAYLKGLGDLAPVTYEELREMGSGAPLIMPYTPTGGMDTQEYAKALAESTEFTQEAVQTAHGRTQPGCAGVPDAQFAARADWAGPNREQLPSLGMERLSRHHGAGRVYGGRSSGRAGDALNAVVGGDASHIRVCV